VGFQDMQAVTSSYCMRFGVQGPEIRTGFLENEQPIKLTTGKEITITTDYKKKGNSELIAMRSATSLAPADVHSAKYF